MDDEGSYVSRESDRLSRAATIGDINALRVLLSETTTIGIDERDSHGYTPLCRACINGHYKIAKLLLELGASPHEPASDGKAPVHLVCQNGNREMLMLLSRFKADPNVKDGGNRTPIHIVIETGHYHMVECLMELGAEIPIDGGESGDNNASGTQSVADGMSYASNSTINNSLMHALSSITGRARSLSNMSTGTSAAGSAVMGGSVSSKRYKHRRTASYVASPPVPSPLIMACATGSADLVGFLLDYLPDEVVDHVSRHVVDPVTGNTMLATACEGGHLEVVDFLLTNQFCDIVERSHHMNWTPLHHAASNGHHQLVYMLVLKFKCDIDDVDSIGRTALHHASVNGHFQVVQILIELGASVDIRDNGSNYPDTNGKLAIDLAIESIYYHRVARAFRNALAARQQRQHMPEDGQRQQQQQTLSNMSQTNEVRPRDIINRRNSRQGRSRSSSASSQSNDTARGNGSDEVAEYLNDDHKKNSKSP